MNLSLIMRPNGMLEPTTRPPELEKVKVGQVIRVKTVDCPDTQKSIERKP